MSKGTHAKAIIIGRMGEAIKTRTSQGGKKFGNLRLAVTDGYGDNEATSWLDVAIFDEKKVEVLEKYTDKGSRIMVIGTLRVRKWTDQSGNDRYSTETVVGFDGSIELLDSKNDAAGSGQRQRSSGDSGGNRTQRTETRAQAASAFDDLDDDVPF